MTKKIFIGSLALAALCGCAPFGSDPTLEERVAQQDMQLRRMQPQQADAMNQIEAMRQEIDQLKGQLRALNSGGAAGQPAQGAAPLDGAPGADDNGARYGLDGQADPAIPLPADPERQGIQVTGAPDSSAYATPPIPVPMTGTASQGSYGLPQDPGGRYQPVDAPSEATWGQADPQPEPQQQTPQKDLSLALFDAGVNSYNSRNYQAAERSFSDLLKNYPNHSQSAEAQFYLGECQFQTNNFPEAALLYETVIKKYPKSSVAPGAYLKQAICFSKMKQMAAARARMQEILSKFPNSPEAARAKSFLKSNK